MPGKPGGDLMGLLLFAVPWIDDSKVVDILPTKTLHIFFENQKWGYALMGGVRELWDNYRKSSRWNKTLGNAMQVSFFDDKFK